MNTKSPVLSQETRNVLASMAIENMFFDDEFLNMVASIEKGELSYDDAVKEVIKQYAR